MDFWEENHGEQNSIYLPDPDGVVLEITWPASTVPRVESPSARLAVRRWAKGSVSA